MRSYHSGSGRPHQEVCRVGVDVGIKLDRLPPLGPGEPRAIKPLVPSPAGARRAGVVTSSRLGWG